MVKRQRKSEADSKLESINEFVKAYQHALKALLLFLPRDSALITTSAIAVVGHCEIWPCQDGVAVVIYRNFSNKIKINVKNYQDKLIRDLHFPLYDASGKHTTRTMSLTHLLNYNDLSHISFDLASNKLVRHDGTSLSFRFQHAIVFGWDANLLEPEEKAIRDVKTVFIIQNVVGQNYSGISFNEGKQLFQDEANKLLAEFNNLLDTSNREEELQIFLTQHPQFLYPDVIECLPKFSLANDFITDYVFSIQGHQGFEYVFVEIEKANKPIFTKAGPFSSEFTQAKDQLLKWENWIERHYAYVVEKLPKLSKPKFHLIMGRSTELSEDQRSILRAEFASATRMFSTYDDVAKRFEQIINQVINDVQ